MTLLSARHKIPAAHKETTWAVVSGAAIHRHPLSPSLSLDRVDITSFPALPDLSFTTRNQRGIA